LSKPVVASVHSPITYAEARWSQSLADWIGCHVNALGFFGGVTRQIVCDNLKAGVIAASRYEPGINRPSGDGGALRHRHRANASAQAA
jgi:transposase